MNALLEALYTRSIRNHRNSCKTQQGAWDASPKMKVASTTTLLMQQHNPHSTWTGNFIIYQVLYVLMSRNKHSYRKAVIKRWLSEPLSLDKAVKFSYISQWLMAQRIKQGYVPTFPSVRVPQVLCCFHVPFTGGTLNAENRGAELATNLCYRGCLRQLASL